MRLYKKTIEILCFGILLLSTNRLMAQDDQNETPGVTSSITFAVVMPAGGLVGLPDISTQQLENKLNVILTNGGLASTDSAQDFIITPSLVINNVTHTQGTIKMLYVANCTLTLYLKQASSKTIFNSYTKIIQGSGFTEDEAKAGIVNGISVDDIGIQKFLNNGRAKIVNYYQQNCQVFMTKAQQETALKHYDAANKILQGIPKETGDCYDQAQVKATEVFEKQYGSLDKAVEYYEKQTTINPASSIFKDILDKAKSLVKSRKERDKTGPVIELTSPKVTRGQTVEADAVVKNEIYVEGSATDPSGIASVKINGKPAKALTDAGFFQGGVPQDATDIVVEATDGKGNIATETFHLGAKTATANTPPPSNDVILPLGDAEKFHAIFIANSDYSGGKWPALKTTTGEALELRKLFIDKYNFDPANVDTVFNKNRNDILTALSSKLEKLGPNDNLVIFYGGHGYYTEITNTAYWVPLHAEKEFDYISNDDISKMIKSCNAKHILIMADACFSGAMRGGAEAPSRYEFKNRSRQLLTSGGSEPVPGKSVYIKALLSNLNSNEDKYVSARDLYNRIFPTIKNEGHTESTLITMLVPGSEGGQFYFKMK